MKRMLALGVGVLLCALSASANTYLYDKPLPPFAPPQGDVPWITLDVNGNVFVFDVTTASTLNSVFFKVQSPKAVSAGGSATARVVDDGDYNLALDFGGVSTGEYTVNVTGWDGIFLLPTDGYYSVAEFADGSWAADSPISVPDGGSTLTILGVTLLGLSQARRCLR
ncbi:MAG TPA: hypothetical protein PKM73_08315 [Verrucomicrobiota bacterium]|nr:hypothetical protein [Verrucomicrobiota bacterium]HNU49551.1 hypothetical protein [Verrucomicrobiota bacterium]